MLQVEKIRQDFKILNKENKLIYLDSACMSLKPNQVVEAMNDYYYNYPACAGRSVHKLSEKVTQKIKESRKIVASFINAKKENEIIFTRNTTEGINLLANSFNFKKGDVVLITDKEHNSNLVPWLVLRDKIGIEVRVCKSKEDNTFDLEKFSELAKGVKLVSFVHTSNLDGVTNPAEEIIKIAHLNNALVLLDCAQSIAHRKIDVQKLDVDFIVFSGHKILGPTGTGIFYGKEKLLQELNPFLVGGDTVEFTTYDNYKMLPVPEKFEAGLQDYAGIIGLAQAINYFQKIDLNEIIEHEKTINKYFTDELSKFPQIKIIGPADSSFRSSVVNFYIENKDMHQFALMLNNMANICIRTGQHCVHSWFESQKIKNSARLSFSFYNKMEEAEEFIKNFKKIIEII